MLPASEFYPHRRMKSGLQPNCRKCGREWHRERPEYIRAKNAEFKRKNPQYAINWSRRARFGLGPADVQAIIDAQHGVCVGCRRGLVSVKACVDHCHSTGVVRGILCNDCNLALGMAQDSPETLRRLAAYVASAREVRS